MGTYRPASPQYDDPLSPTSAPSLSFKDAPVGHTYKGTITKPPSLVQSRNFETGEPATWPDGNPKMSVVIQLDVEGETRSLWAAKPSSMFAALVAAQKVAGGQPMQAGGVLWVKFTGTVPNAKNPRLNEAKQYAAKYDPPVRTDPFGDEPPPIATPPPSAWGAQGARPFASATPAPAQPAQPAQPNTPPGAPRW